MLRWFVVLLLLLPSWASAHVLAYGTVSTELNVDGRLIHLQSEVSQNINIYGISEDEARARYQKYFDEQIQIHEKGAPCPFSFETFDPSFDSPHSTFTGTFRCPTEVTSLERLTIHSKLFYDAFEKFEHFLTVTIGSDRYALPFSTERNDFPETVTAQKIGSTLDYFIAVAVRFIWMGMGHIFTGYDHILFLLSVILLARNFKQIVILVTSFTLAHSFTLILAGFHIVSLSAHIVEPAIAATILYMAWRNIRSLKDTAEIPHEHRVPLTFAFGLVHGLGFASALAETTIPQIFFVPALITFNVGIELGQLSILALVLPILWYIDSTAYRIQILKYFSYCVCFVAAIWILTRIFL